MPYTVIVDGIEYINQTQAAKEVGISLPALHSAIDRGYFRTKKVVKVSKKVITQIMVDDLCFDSYENAAKHLGVSVQSIRLAIRRGRHPIFAKTEVKKGRYIRQNENRYIIPGHPCMVDSIEYPSIAQAARAIHCHPRCLATALSLGQGKYKGHFIVDLADY